MAKYSELHLKLEELANQYLNDQTDENSTLLIAEVTRLLLEDADVLIDGAPDEEEPDKFDPFGYEGPDGRFYFHVYSSKLRFDDAEGSNPLVTKLKSIMDQVFANDAFGGISLNYCKGAGTILISKEDVRDGLQAVIQSAASQNNPK